MGDFEVVIVGAGAAGIAAARWLRAQGVETLILEARDRVGGRAHTDNTTFGTPIDLGCAFLHHADHNLWATYMRAQGLRIDERPLDWRRRVGNHLRSADEQAAVDAALNRDFELVDQAGEAGRDVAVSTLIPDDAARPMFDAIMTWLMGIESDAVSSLDLARFADSDVNWTAPDGLGSAIAHATRDLPVRLQTPVTALEVKADHVRLETSGGALRARAVIVTVPTNVLLEGRPRIVPSLPAELHAALEGIPLGIANKVFLQMDPRALPYEGTAHFIGTDRSAHTGSYATRPAGAESLLLGYFGGRFARDLETRGALEEFARAELKSIFGADLVAGVRRSLVTGWSSDPWALGSYSAARPGCARLRERLAEPVHGRLLLAGEACSIEYFGTAHGAAVSGEAAAARALAVIGRPSPRPSPA